MSTEREIVMRTNLEDLEREMHEADDSHDAIRSQFLMLSYRKDIPPETVDDAERAVDIAWSDYLIAKRHVAMKRFSLKISDLHNI